MEVTRFVFRVIDPKTETIKCTACKVYAARIEVKFNTEFLTFTTDLFLCTICLGRLRSTLKSALKAIPAGPKRIYPKDIDDGTTDA